MQRALVFLLDTNVIIPAEPTGSGHTEPLMYRITQLLGRIQQTHNEVRVHPELYRDIHRDKNLERRRLRVALASKYARLQKPPPLSPALKAILGDVSPQSHDWIDHHLLAAVTASAVDFLITEDIGLHRKAVRVGVDDRVLTVADALDVIRGLYEAVPVAPPAVDTITADRLDPTDPIFDSLREDYEGFDEWLSKVIREKRTSWVIRAAEHLAAILIVNEEVPGEHGLYGKVLKLCTFKVSDDHEGYRYGELLLKAVFDYAESNEYEWIFTTVLPDKEFFINYLSEFGFEVRAEMKADREHVLVKHRFYSEEEVRALDPLSFHARFGPPAVKWAETPSFIVPIVPEYHMRLFPEAESQMSMLAGYEAYGNGLRKAYLSRSSLRSIGRGDVLYFYRSHRDRGVRVVGVVEAVHVLSDPAAIVRAVGKRTLYRFHEIAEMTAGDREVLVVDFRQAKVLGQPLELDELVQNNVVAAWPQTIQPIQPEGAAWVARRFGL